MNISTAITIEPPSCGGILPSAIPISRWRIRAWARPSWAKSRGGPTLTKQERDRAKRRAAAQVWRELRATEAAPEHCKRCGCRVCPRCKTCHNPGCEVAEPCENLSSEGSYV